MIAYGYTVETGAQLVEKQRKAREVLDTLGTSERGYAITRQQMGRWIIKGQPIKPEHGAALMAYIQERMTAYAEKQDDSLS